MAPKRHLSKNSLKDTIFGLNQNSLLDIASYLPFIACEKTEGKYGGQAVVCSEAKNIPPAPCNMKNININFIYDMSIYIKYGYAILLIQSIRPYVAFSEG